VNSKCVGWWGEKYGRHISWSDDGKQPEDELLLVISFPTGAYIFGDDYPTEFFKEFFQELKTYNPKYTDTTNKTLYFQFHILFQLEVRQKSWSIIKSAKSPSFLAALQ